MRLCSWMVVLLVIVGITGLGCRSPGRLPRGCYAGQQSTISPFETGPNVSPGVPDGWSSASGPQYGEPMPQGSGSYPSMQGSGTAPSMQGSGSR